MPVPVVPAISSDFVLLSHLILSVYRSIVFLNKQEKNHFLGSSLATNPILKELPRAELHRTFSGCLLRDSYTPSCVPEDIMAASIQAMWCLAHVVMTAICVERLLSPNLDLRWCGLQLASLRCCHTKSLGKGPEWR